MGGIPRTSKRSPFQIGQVNWKSDARSSLCPCQPGICRRKTTRPRRRPCCAAWDFRALDESRREAITNAEQIKARRNELSQQVGEVKKDMRKIPSLQNIGLTQKLDAVMEETRALKDKLDALDSTAAQLDEQMRLSLSRIPNLTRDEVPIGISEADNDTVKTWGDKPSFDFHPQAPLGTRRATRHPRSRTRRQALRRAFCRLYGSRRPPRTRSHQLHA